MQTPPMPRLISCLRARAFWVKIVGYCMFLHLGVQFFNLLFVTCRSFLTIPLEQTRCAFVQNTFFY